jgi:hypothetical protein
MSKQVGKDVKLLDAAEITPSGVIRLIELQEKAMPASGLSAEPPGN